METEKVHFNGSRYKASTTSGGRRRVPTRDSRVDHAASEEIKKDKQETQFDSAANELAAYDAPHHMSILQKRYFQSKRFPPDLRPTFASIRIIRHYKALPVPSTKEQVLFF